MNPQKKDKQNRGLTYRAIRGLLWTFSSTSVEAILQIVVTVVLARLLTPSDFGIVGAASVVIGFSRIFAQLGIGPAIIQRTRLSKRHIRTGFTVSLVFGLLLTTVVAVLAPLVARFFSMPALTPILRTLSLLFSFRSISVVSESLLRRELRLRFLAIRQLVAFFFGSGVVGVGLAMTGFGVWALVYGQLAEAALRSVILLFAVPHSKRLNVNRRALKDLMYFGTGVTLANVGTYFALQGDNIVVGRWLGAGSLGLYSRAYALMAAPAHLFGDIAEKVLFPALAKVQEKPKRLAVAFLRGCALLALLVLPVSAAVFVLVPEIVHVLLGSNWTGVIAPLQVLSAGIFFRTAYKLGQYTVRARGAVFRMAILQWIYAGLIISGALMGKVFGITGVAIAILGTLIIHYSLMMRLTLTVLSISWKEFFESHYPAIRLAVAVFTVSWIVTNSLRSFQLNAIMTLSITGTALAGLVFVLGRFAPSLFFGKDGSWWLKTFSNYFREMLPRKPGQQLFAVEQEPM